jgi:Holliday junction resolvasome RuvABC endonuclease subunit
MLSLDLGMYETGVVWWDDRTGQFMPVRYDTLKQKRSKTATWLYMADQIAQEVFSGQRFDAVILEDVYQGVNPQSVKTLSMLLGASMYIALTTQPDLLVALSTAEIDTACKIRTGISRAQRKLATHKLARLELPGGISQDVADAYCVGVAGIGVWQEYHIRQQAEDIGF